jgi:hypothetical protein
VSENDPPLPGPESMWEPTWDPDTGPLPTAELPAAGAAVEPAVAADSSDADPGGDPKEGEAPRSGPRSHRAPFAPDQLLSRILAPLAAIAAVIVVVVLLIWINGRPGGTTSAALANTPAHSSVPSVVTVVTPTKSSAPAAPPSTAPATTPSSTPATAKTTAPPVPAAHTKPPKPPVTNAMAPVQVLNNSRRTGLAHEVAAALAAKGWQLGLIGNLQGLVSQTTVYYAPGEKAAAEHLEREFSSIRRIEPNSAEGLTSSGITLVLTADWAG